MPESPPIARARQAATIAGRLALVALGALAWFRPSGLWSPPVGWWTPVLAAGAIAAVIGLLPVPRAEEQRDVRFRPALDLGMVAVLTVGAGLLLRAWAARHNPDAAMVGMDSPTYLDNAWAAAEGNWKAFNGDKRSLHARVVGWIGGGGDVRRACQDVSLWSIAALPALTYLAGIPAFGRVAALGAAVAAFWHPLLWAFSVQTTSYAFMFAMTLATLAVASWITVSNSLLGWGAFGVLAGLDLLTTEKSPTVLVPVAFVLVCTAGLRALPGAALASGLCIASYLALAPPVTFTPFGNLVVNQREELYREMPWRWESVKRPDPQHPTPFDLPRWFRFGEIESTLSAMTTPPDSDGLRVRYDADPARTAYVWVPRTSIAPTAERWRQNLRALDQALDGQGDRWAAALAMGAVLSVLLPGRRAAAAVLVASLPAMAGPLSLKFVYRYFVQHVPVMALLVVGGARKLAGMAAGRGRIPRIGVALVALGVAFAWGVVQLRGRLDAWMHPTFALPAPAAELNLLGHPLAMAQTADWVAEDAGGAVLLDCAPIPVAPQVPGGYERARHGESTCTAALQGAEPGTLLVVSDYREYRFTTTLSARDVMASGHWDLAQSFAAQGGSEAAVHVFRAR